MSNLQNDIIKENICEEIGSMTVDEFQDALEKGVEGNSVIDSLVENLVEKKFEEVSH